MPDRRQSYRNAADDLHRTVGQSPVGSAHLLPFGKEERENALTVTFAGCQECTHGNNDNSHLTQSMLHSALCSGFMNAS